MPDRAWKATERRVASMIGGQRVPITGRQRGDVPDVDHPWPSVEVKHRKRLPAWIEDAMGQARASARSGQLPIAVLHESQRQHTQDLFVVRLGDWLDWFGRAK